MSRKGALKRRNSPLNSIGSVFAMTDQCKTTKKRNKENHMGHCPLIAPSPRAHRAEKPPAGFDCFDADRLLIDPKRFFFWILKKGSHFFDQYIIVFPEGIYSLLIPMGVEAAVSCHDGMCTISVRTPHRAWHSNGRFLHRVPPFFFLFVAVFLCRCFSSHSP